MATGNYDGARAGAKHVPGAIAILLASSLYCAADNGKLVRLIKKITTGSSTAIKSEGELVATLFSTSKESSAAWEVEAVDDHLHFTANYPFCVDNNVYKQKYLLIIGDESLLKAEVLERVELMADQFRAKFPGLASNHN